MERDVRVGLAQINSYLGDFVGNRKKIVDYCNRAKEKRCEIVVFPEAALFGYHPVDLLERKDVVKKQESQLKLLAKEIPSGILVLVGAITFNQKPEGKPYYNSAVLIEKGKIKKIFPKQLLPTYDVFDEGRHIEPGEIKLNTFKYKGKNILVTICEDIWAWPEVSFKKRSLYKENPLKDVKGKIDIVLNLSASPYTNRKRKLRRKAVELTAQLFRAPMVYVNMVGGQDELVFDGGSFAVSAKGKTLCQSTYFHEDLNLVDLNENNGGLRDTKLSSIEFTRQALILGIRDFVKKTGQSRVHLGVSGGIDSAVVACLAVDALGPNNVNGIFLPGPFSSEESKSLSHALEKNLGIKLDDIKINDGYESILKELTHSWGDVKFSLMHENIQARMRCLVLMAFANLNNSLLLNTSNKSELAMGYSTLYGDMGGAIAPIGDMLKGQVFELAKHYNSEWELIPQRIIDRPPTAELRENQKDEDSLPPYSILDESVSKLVVGATSPSTEVDKRVYKSLMQTEFKRWQAPPIIKVSDHAFGRGRRLPIAQFINI